MTIDTTCPKCRTPHARKLALIYAEGKTVIDQTVNTVGTFNTIGRQQITTTGSIRGVNQSEASKSAAPPAIPRLRSRGEVTKSWAITGCLILPIVAFVIAMNGGASFAACMTVAGVVLAVLAAVASFTDIHPAQDEIDEHRARYPNEYAAYAEWEQTFGCVGCGYRFIPQAESGTQLAI